MVSTVVAVLALTAACLVSSSSAQATGATIKCYKCGPNDYGCGSSNSVFNASVSNQVTCYGQCTKAVTWGPTSDATGPVDGIYRGCTVTTPSVGCDTWESTTTGASLRTCVSVCSTDLCNSAVSLTQSLVVSTVGLLVAVLNFRRK